MTRLSLGPMLAMTAFGSIISAGAANAQLAPPPAPVSRPMYQQLLNRPAVLDALIAPPPAPLVSPPPAQPAGSPWTRLTHQPTFNAGAMLLLTDGTVLVADQGPSNSGGANWWRLTPSNTGSYVNGTWSQVASLPATYQPLYFASAVLPDGRVLIEGGEFNLGNPIWTTRGAIYDPLANAWTPVKPPAGWTTIGDAASTLLANGRFMLANCCSTQAALFNANTLTWAATGVGKADSNNEEGLSLLPDGSVLTVDANNVANLTNSEKYTPATGVWASAGSTVVRLDDTNANGSGTHEVGPQVLRPSGSVFGVGATGNTATFNRKTNLWAAGPRLPVIGGVQYISADGPAAVLPSGNVLIAASAGIFAKPVHFFVFDGAHLTQVADTFNAASLSSFFCMMLVLPTGQILFNSRFNDMEIYTDAGSAAAAWAPVITSVPTTIARGVFVALSGKQLNGLTQGAAYGDDYQSATNYPLVRVVNTASGHVFYARTTGHTKMSVAPNVVSTTHFTLPAGTETGPGSLVVVANGIASKPVAVTISAAAAE
jgi:hypothetical protein